MNGLADKVTQHRDQAEKSMMTLLSSNILMLPELPSVSRGRERRHFARYRGNANGAGHCPRELNRWIGRWENEGGAIAARKKSPRIHHYPLRWRDARAFAPQNKQTFMKQTNNHEQMIKYGPPLMSGGQRRRRGYPAINYNDRSSEMNAMNAHLKASAYGDQSDGKQLESASRLTNSATPPRHRLRWFLHLGDRYDTQARHNFKREAVLFVLIAALSIWSIIHAVQTARG
jgi:hypothetical protein